MILQKKQIYLTREQAERLRAIARERQVSEAALVRQALARFLAAEGAEPADALLPLIGTAKAQPGHDASTVDRDLYGGRP